MVTLRGYANLSLKHTDGRAHREEKIRDLYKLFLLISISSSIVVTIFSHVGFILLKRFMKYKICPRNVTVFLC